MPFRRIAVVHSETTSNPAFKRGERARFTDSTGMSWAVRVSTRREAVLSIESRSATAVTTPILRFDSSSSSRALTAFPADWASLPARELEALCKRARLMPPP